MSEHDVIVVGSGAGAGFAALGLCEAGIRVLLLERGRAFDPTTDYPMNYPDWERHNNPLRILGMDPTIIRELGAELEPDTGHLCSRGGMLESVLCKQRSRYRYHRVYGLGGTTLHYQGEAHRFAEYAFRSHSEYGFGVDWPLTYRDLEPFYHRAEQVLGVAGDARNPFKPKREPFPTPAHRLSNGSQIISKAASKLGWTLWPNSLALPTRSVDGRSPCRRSGGCVQGCIFGAKSSTDVSALARASATGRLTVQTEARVVEVQTNANRVTGVVYVKNNKRHRVRAAIVVLGLGAIETPRLLLASRNRYFPGGVGNQLDNVGRYYLDTVLVAITAQFEQDLKSYQGPPIDAKIWDFAKPKAGAKVRSGYVLGVSGTMSGYHGPLSYMRRTPGIGLAHKNAMREKFGRYLTIFGIAEQEPQRQNRIELSQQIDDAGVPMVHMRTQFSAADRAVTAAMLENSRKLLEMAGAKKLLYIHSTYNRPSAAQIGGGCRMGTDAKDAVTDPWGKVHGLKNLFITDGSVLPGQGAGDALTLTIEALALRTAERIATLRKQKVV